MAARPGPGGSCPPIPADFQSSKYTLVPFPTFCLYSLPHFSLLLIPVAHRFLHPSRGSGDCYCCCRFCVAPRLESRLAIRGKIRACHATRFRSSLFVSFYFRFILLRSSWKPIIGEGKKRFSVCGCKRMSVMVAACGPESVNQGGADRAVRILRDCIVSRISFLLSTGREQRFPPSPRIFIRNELALRRNSTVDDLRFS